MLDCKVTLFQLPMPNTRVEQDKAQIISGCNAYLGQAFLSAHGIYSELEQDSCAYLNCNDYNGKAIEIEICLKTNKENLYSYFCLRCVTLRTDKGLVIKKNGPINDKHITRINMNGESVIGMGVFLSDADFKHLSETQKIGFEGAFSLGKVNNTYGFNIIVSRNNGDYVIESANTYKFRNRSINSMWH